MKSRRKSKPVPASHEHCRGKALLSLGVGIMLVMYGLGYLVLESLALVIGIIWLLKGTIQFLGSNSCDRC